MKISIDQIREITQGAVSVFENDGRIYFRRFTKEQEELYRVTNEGFWKKSFSTAGVKMCFKTDSEWMELKTFAVESSTRTYFSVDVFVEDQYVDSLDNFNDGDLIGDYTVAILPLGHYEKMFWLGKGMKTITVYFPWSVDLQIEELCLEDSATLVPVRPKKRMVVFGDSITHGYDAVRPVNRYISRVAEALGAEEFNKAIGGEVFFPELANTRESFEPDYIFAVYGTNDWGTTTWDSFAERCPRFYKALAENYPKAKIFALTPIWRKDHTEVRQCCDFLKIGEYIRQTTKEYSNIVVIDCFDFIAKEEKYFADFRLHPNDQGFEHYAKNLMEEIFKQSK